jgi:hypothetical protein
LRGAEAVELPGPLGRLGFTEVWVDAIRRVAAEGGRLDWQVFAVPGVREAEACRSSTGRMPAKAGEPLVRLDIYEPAGEVGSRAYSAEDVRAGRAVMVFPLFATRGRELVLGLVPDGVASVEVKAGDMPPQVAKVQNNFFQVEAQVPTSHESRGVVSSVTTTLTWLDASGRSLETVSRSDKRTLLLNATVEIPEG